MIAERRHINEPAAIGHEERGGGLEFFRLALFGGDEIVVPVRPRKLQRGEAGADGGARLMLRA